MKIRYRSEVTSAALSLVAPTIEIAVQARKAPSTHSCRLPMIGRRFTTQSSTQAATARAPMILSIVMMPAPWFR